MPNVRPIRPREGDSDDGLDGNMNLRRLAVQVAAMLPADHDDAIKVLDLSRRIVVEFYKD